MGLEVGNMNQRCRQHFSFADFFHDMPWLETPQDRQSNFIEPLYPRGGLLGGSGASPKMSKLQQLAAERKRKADEQKAKEKNKNNVKQPVHETTEKLSKLSVGSDDKKKVLSPTPTNNIPATDLAVRTVPTKRKTGDVVQPDAPPAEYPIQAEQKPHGAIAFPEPAAPSDFAQALLGSAPPAHAIRTYSLPYMAFTSSVADAFSGPSPDDVVLTAQAKGSLAGARKA
jgi:elongation factor 1 alpha-like protein